MPPLSDEVFGSANSKDRQIKGLSLALVDQPTMDNSDRINNSEFFSLKESLISQTVNN
jgi:hypothetical protein